MAGPLVTITGASSGIGLALAHAFAREGNALLLTATKYGVRAFSESLQEAEGRNGVRVINVAPGYIRTNIHAGMGITFERYKEALGNPDFLSAEELADVVLYCWKLPKHICIRDIAVTPTRTTF
jgi:NADP-dependent 3-hydroxy acid dehydrogenase YdfG